MTPITLHDTLDDLQQSGLNTTIRVMVQNVVLYRKWGDLGKFGEYQKTVLGMLIRYQPEYHQIIFKLLNEA